MDQQTRLAPAVMQVLYCTVGMKKAELVLLSSNPQLGSDQQNQVIDAGLLGSAACEGLHGPTQGLHYNASTVQALGMDFKPTSNNNNRNIYSAIMSVSANPSKVLQMSERASSEVVCDFKKKEKDVHI